MNLRVNMDKFVYENFNSKLPMKRELVQDPETSDYFRHFKDENNSGSKFDYYDGSERDLSDSPTRQPRGMIVRVFDGDLSQT